MEVTVLPGSERMKAHGLESHLDRQEDLHSDFASPPRTRPYRPWVNLDQLQVSTVLIEMSNRAKKDAKREAKYNRKNPFNGSDGAVQDESPNTIAAQLPFETELSKSRLIEWENTQLLIMRIESRNVLLLTDPRKFFAMGTRALSKWVQDHLSLAKKRAQRLGKEYKEITDPLAQPGQEQVISVSQLKHVDEDSEVIWRKHDGILATLWLTYAPWVQWFKNFFFITWDLTFHARGIGLFGWVGWVYLAVLAPILFLAQLFYNFAHFVQPVQVESLVKRANAAIYDDALFEGSESDTLQAQAELVEPPASGPVYSQAKAEYLCRISAAMYSRESAVFAEAQKMYRDAIGVPGVALPSTPVLAEPAHARLRDRLRLELHRSEFHLRRFAKGLDLEYNTVSELNSGFGGPFASMFWKKEQSDGDNFIIIAVKGTQPLDVREWLIDAGCQRVKMARRFFPYAPAHRATAHEGFYSSLFPDRHREDWNWLYRGVYASDATAQIVRAINIKASEWRAERTAQGKAPGKTYVWVTGHSLGAAIASILYARLLVCELHPDCQLRDAYTYGTPMNTDIAFVEYYRDWMKQKSIHLASPPSNAHRYNFRIINNEDVVTKVPPTPNLVLTAGVGEVKQVGLFSQGSVLDYAGIGYGIKYTNSGEMPKGLDQIDHVCNGLDPIVPAAPATGLVALFQKFERSRFNPIGGLTDHSTLAYQHNLALARQAILTRAGQSLSNGATGSKVRSAPAL